MSGTNGESSMETYTLTCKIDSQWEFAVWFKELKLGFCDNLEGWDGVGGGREGTYVYLRLMHIDVWQKPTQYCNYPSIKNKFKSQCVSSFFQVVFQKILFCDGTRP